MSIFKLPLTEILLRVGVAFSFLYPPIAALADPDSWIGYIPAFVLSLGLDPFALLHAFGLLEVALALWILIGKRIFIPSIVATLLLLLIVGFNGAQFPILFRDVSISLMAFALAWMHRA